MASAMMERAELPVHRKRTLKGRSMALRSLLWRPPGASDRGQGLISDPAHHCLKVLTYFARKRQPFDGCHRTQQRQYTNVIRRKLTTYCSRALDQSIQLFKVGEKIVDVATRVGAQFNEVTNGFALAQIVVVERRDRCEFRKPEQGIAGPCEQRRLGRYPFGPGSNLWTFCAGQNSI